MTVRELIQRLKQEDPDAYVVGEYDADLFDMDGPRAIRITRRKNEYSADSVYEDKNGAHAAVLLVGM